MVCEPLCRTPKALELYCAHEITRKQYSGMAMSLPQPVRLLIKARWIIPVVPENRVLENCAVAVNNGLIVALLPQDEAEKRFAAEQTINLGNHILIPGLINAHG